MYKNLIILLRYFAFWLIFFFLERLVFILYNCGRLKGISIAEVGDLIFYGAWMDASMAGYFCAIPLLTFVVIWLGGIRHFPVVILKVYTITLIVVCSFLTVVNFNIYREWGTKINYRALEFAFGSPAEAFSSSESSPVFLSLLIFAILTAVSIILLKKTVVYRIVRGGSLLLLLPASLLVLGFNFLAIRGGWQLSPMNESMAYFSLRPILNYAAVNTEWSLIHDILNNKYSKSNPFKYYKPSEAKQIVNSLYTKPVGKPEMILASDKPNVVIIMMESFTANVVESLGGEKGVDPALEKLISQGLFFNNIYASGFRTDKGVVAILSAFPAQAKRSIMKENSKQVKIPALPQTLSKMGYSTSFYYGGESRFFNMRSYLLGHDFEKIIEKSDFSSDNMSSKWGAYDGPVYSKMVAKLGEERQPFLATMLTLTNHEPFDLPTTPRFKGEDVENKFRSTAYYADSCLGAFINEARTQHWYKNTLFIVVADHGHRLPRTHLDISDPAHYRIPLLFFGDVIKPEYRGVKIDKIGTQNDIAATLLHQLSASSDSYPWSKDLLNPNSPAFSFFNWDQGFGFATPEQIITFDTMGQNIIYREKKGDPAVDKKLLRYGKACMQEVYQRYIDF